jgi:hypothetical protein
MPECTVCSDTFGADPAGAGDRTELNPGKPAGYCSLACPLDADGGGSSDE